MLSLREWFFEPIEEKDGRIVTFSRFHVFLIVVVALSTMILLSATQESAISGRLRLSVFFATACCLLALLSSRRRIIFGAALAIIAIRCIFGVFALSHAFVFIVLSVATATGSYLLLKGAR